MSNPHQSAYRQIMKATSIFGGVQFYQIILTIVRTKIVAVLLGTQGMGIAGLLTSVTTLISGLTNFGLGVSAVKNVAEANATGDLKRVAIVSGVLKKLVWITGFIGMAVVLILSPWLSEWTFGNNDYTLAFIGLSGTMLLVTLTSGQYVLLQGLQRMTDLAKANVLGATLALFVSVPLYYYYGLDGIAPAMVLSALTALVVAFYFGSKVSMASVPLASSTIVKEGKEMVKMGLLLSLSGVIATASAYLIRIYISRTGGVEDVGLFNAGFAIVNTYVGMIFAAMATDYYPRLSAVANSLDKARQLINQQAEMALLILGPLLIVFLIFLKFAIVLLYSAQFVGVIGMVQWIVLAIFLKAVTWAMGFMLLARGASKLFFYSELVANIYGLILNILGYYLLGLEGLGISFFVGYVLSIIQTFLILKIRYAFRFEIELYKTFFMQFIMALVCFLLVRYIKSSYSYLLASPLIVFVCIYSYSALNSRINLIELVKSRLTK